MFLPEFSIEFARRDLPRPANDFEAARPLHRSPERRIAPEASAHRAEGSNILAGLGVLAVVVGLAVASTLVTINEAQTNPELLVQALSAPPM
jgi:hypothetical protein